MRQSNRLRAAAAISLGLLSLVMSPSRAVGQEERKWSPNSVMQVKLDSMMAIALAAPAFDDRSAAIIGILRVGAVSAMLPGEPYPGVVRRLRAIYEREPSHVLRASIVRRLDELAERPEKLEFLRMVAAERRADEDELDFPVPLIAVEKLARMGPDGWAILQELAAEDALKNPIARVRLRKLQEQGWELKPPS